MTRKEAYQIYLRSDHWIELRSLALDRDKKKCVLCGSIDNLEVHHKRYRDRFEDSVLGDLITLCHNCHTDIHLGRKKIPKKQVKTKKSKKRAAREKRNREWMNQYLKTRWKIPLAGYCDARAPIVEASIRMGLDKRSKQPQKRVREKVTWDSWGSSKKSWQARSMNGVMS